jgi:hypothetical protein
MDSGPGEIIYPTVSKGVSGVKPLRNPLLFIMKKALLK